MIGNILPLAPDQLKESVTAVIPPNLKGLSLWARKSFEREVTNEFDYPLTARYDESDCMLVFQDVFVPWERVFIYRDVDLVRSQFFETGAHMLGNSQAQIRFWTKLEFIVGLASSIAKMNRVDREPAVQQSLGHMAAQIAPDRSRPTWPTNAQPSPEQAKEAVAGYVAYFGRYEVDQRERNAKHQREAFATEAEAYCVDYKHHAQGGQCCCVPAPEVA